MFAFEVVVREVVADLAARGGDMIVSGHFEFGLEGSEPTFRECVVVAVVGAAHALGDLGAQFVLDRFIGKLIAGVGAIG